MNNKNKPVTGIIGAGNMGGAIIRGLLSRDPAASVIASDPRPEVLDALKKTCPALEISTGNTRAAGSGILVLAVKPQVLKNVIQSIKNHIKPETLVVSIAAGITLNTLKKWLSTDEKPHSKIIRAMPNTPAMIGAGITAVCPAENINAEERQSVENIFAALGKTVVMPEHLMDAYSALAASSPAWTFMYIEALADAAVREGIPRSDAYTIASNAVMGAARLAAETARHPALLKDQVCSPGGTTIEGAAVLEKAGFRSAVIQAMESTTLCGRQLGKKLETL